SIKRKKKILALSGMLLAIAATALGGSSVQINENLRNGPAIGLDWFLLDLFLMALIYVPLERLWPQYPEQGTFRNQWTLDVVYFMSTHLPIQILSFLVLLPATQAVKYLGVPVLQHSIARMPWPLQFFLAVVVADVAEYFVHLALHKVPFLWRFMPSTILRRPLIGSLAHAPTLLTTHLYADLFSFLLCLDFRNRSS